MLRIVDALARIVARRRQSPRSESERHGSAHRGRDAGAARVDAARLRRLRARRLHAERDRLSLRAHDRGGGGVGAAAALRAATRRSPSIRCSISSRARARITRGADFLESWYGFLLVAGNAYVEAVAVGGRLRELHVLRPDRMKVVPGADGWPEAYEYTVGRTARCASTRSRCPACARSCTCASSIRPTTTTA